MSSIVSFIGWHDSGKTELVCSVVSELKLLGYRVAVIKSSNDHGIEFDRPGTDTFRHREAGADGVLLVAPDQLVLQTGSSDLSLTTLAHRYFPDADIVIGEGFKGARKIAKIEVIGNPEQKLRNEVHGVLAIATDLEGIHGDYVFRRDEAREIALFLEKRFLTSKSDRELCALLVNGQKVPVKAFVQETLASTVLGFVSSLKLHEDIGEIELRFRCDKISKPRERNP